MKLLFQIIQTDIIININLSAVTESTFMLRNLMLSLKSDSRVFVNVFSCFRHLAANTYTHIYKDTHTK